MLNSPIIAQLFEDQTTVSLHALDAYLSKLPTYHRRGKRHGFDPFHLALLQQVDSFEYAFKCYLAGHEKTLHWVFYQIRQFHAVNPLARSQIIACSLENVREVLLRNEWYELLPRFTLAQARIQKRFPQDTPLFQTNSSQ